ncbi:hypothetical protein R1sor_004791 [Riccia sorocarpa]|uniref:Reverse transcriptase zinc-binding domain-containing protein n=1 Tax=Riccia sorocarpa TaxID=122646 RepID=A0ABD3HHP3_9MARC
MNCFFTGDRANKMQVSNGRCQRCAREIETTSHLFWRCSEVWSTWAECRAGVATAGICLGTSLLDTIDEALIKKAQEECRGNLQNVDGIYPGASGIRRRIAPAGLQAHIAFESVRSKKTQRTSRATWVLARPRIHTSLCRSNSQAHQDASGHTPMISYPVHELLAPHSGPTPFHGANTPLTRNRGGGNQDVNSSDTIATFLGSHGGEKQKQTSHFEDFGQEPADTRLEKVLGEGHASVTIN